MKINLAGVEIELSEKEAAEVLETIKQKIWSAPGQFSPVPQFVPYPQFPPAIPPSWEFVTTCYESGIGTIAPGIYSVSPAEGRFF